MTVTVGTYDRFEPVKAKFCPMCGSEVAREKFERLYKEWTEETAVMSTGQFDHPAYRGIVNMGKAAVPYIREKIKDGPDPIVAALGEIMPGVVKTEGYLSMTDICKIWDIALELDDQAD